MHVVRRAGEVRVVGTRRVTVQLDGDPDPGQGGLHRLRRLNVLGPVAAVGETGGEPVRVPAGLQRRLRRGEIAARLAQRVVHVEALVADDVRRVHRGRDRAAGVRAAERGLLLRLVRRVLDRLAAGQVVHRRYLRVEVEEVEEAGDRVVGLLHQRRVGQDLRARRGLHAGARRVDVDVAGQQAVVKVVRVHVQVDDDLGRVLLGLRVLGRRPVRVVDQGRLLVQLVAGEHVGTGGDRVELVVGARVLGRRDRGGLRDGHHVVEVGERLQQVELDRVRVRRGDRGEARPSCPCTGPGRSGPPAGRGSSSGRSEGPTGRRCAQPRTSRRPRSPPRRQRT